MLLRAALSSMRTTQTRLARGAAPRERAAAVCMVTERHRECKRHRPTMPRYLRRLLIAVPVLSSRRRSSCTPPHASAMAARAMLARSAACAACLPLLRVCAGGRADPAGGAVLCPLRSALLSSRGRLRGLMRMPVCCGCRSPADDRSHLALALHSHALWPLPRPRPRPPLLLCSALAARPP